MWAVDLLQCSACIFSKPHTLRCSLLLFYGNLTAFVIYTSTRATAILSPIIGWQSQIPYELFPHQCNNTPVLIHIIPVIMTTSCLLFWLTHHYRGYQNIQSCQSHIRPFTLSLSPPQDLRSMVAWNSCVLTLFLGGFKHFCVSFWQSFP